MKAEHRNARTCLPTDTLERTTHNLWEFDVGGLAVSDSEPASSGVITDRDLVNAAYTQAVALYDSCVQYATVGEVVKRGRSALSRQLQHNEDFDVALR